MVKKKIEKANLDLEKIRKGDFVELENGEIFLAKQKLQQAAKYGVWLEKEGEANTKDKITKYYIAHSVYNNGQWYNFVDIVPRANGLKIYLRQKVDKYNDPGKVLIDCSKIGHWTTGNSFFYLPLDSNIDYLSLIKQAYENTFFR